jgi:hypothetical protein
MSSQWLIEPMSGGQYYTIKHFKFGTNLAMLQNDPDIALFTAPNIPSGWNIKKSVGWVLSMQSQNIQY